jgi:pimeloyl-ACP methyl ester carboxylesterase
VAGLAAPALAAGTLEHPITTVADPAQVRYGTVPVDGLNIAYREAGDASLPKLVLLHGWPSSSHQFRDMIPLLARRFHVIAPDYQGFGNSDAPDPASYAYSFEGISRTIEKFLAAKGFDHYGLFVQDYGGPVGFRIVSRNPAALDWLVVQNSNAYEEGFSPAWDGFRNALWVNRNADTEKPLAAFNTPEGIKGVYLLARATRSWSVPMPGSVTAPSSPAPTTCVSSSTCSTITGRTRRSTRRGRSCCATASRRR